jgi:hypothetical protein
MKAKIVKTFDGSYVLNINGICSPIYKGYEEDAPQVLKDLEAGKSIYLEEAKLH